MKHRATFPASSLDADWLHAPDIIVEKEKEMHSTSYILISFYPYANN